MTKRQALSPPKKLDIKLTGQYNVVNAVNSKIQMLEVRNMRLLRF